MRRDLFRDPDPDPAGDLDMIFAHARLAGFFGLPRQEYADDEAETASLDGHAEGRNTREEHDAKKFEPKLAIGPRDGRLNCTHCSIGASACICDGLAAPR